jgi:hypothetical protein
MNSPAPERPPASPARRRLLVAASGVAVLGGTGALWIGSRLDGKRAWIEAVLREHLPGVQLDPASLATFVAHFAENRVFEDGRSNLAMMLDQSVPSLTQQVSKAARRVDRLERRVVTEYLLGSNFFRVADPRKETIVYSAAPPACGNPFAVFRDA